ncbi:MAG: YraN family protein [Lentisphaeria bacterium]|nr:YraN family protein [Lentisphaeria bacterium]
MIWQCIVHSLMQFRKRWRWRRLRRAHLRLGRRGERAAARLLENTGSEILCLNYRAGHDEIDLVARENCVLCFVEVKTRRYKPGIRPAEAVDAEKRRHIMRGARRYLREIGSPELPIRFDIIEVITQGYRIGEIRQMKNAFRR